MPTTWQPHQAKRFARELKLNTPYYVVRQIETRAIPWEDPEMYEEHVFTGRLPFTGTPCTDGGFSAATLCQNFGPVYETKPRGLRRSGEPGPQVGAPLGRDYTAYLDEAELRGLDKRLRDASDPRTRRI